MDSVGKMSQEYIMVTITDEHVMTGVPLLTALQDLGYRSISVGANYVCLHGQEYEVDDVGAKWMRRYLDYGFAEPITITLRATNKSVYRHLRSFEETRSYSDGIVYLQTADNTLFAVAPAARVEAFELRLLQLGADLSELRWPGVAYSPWSWGAIRYARLAIGGIVYGRLQAVTVTPDIWVDQKLIEKGLEADIRAVIEGRQERIHR